MPTRRLAIAADPLPGGSDQIVFTVNELGVRGRPVRLEDVDLRILCVGGSTTECGYLTDELTWPWQLQDKLARRLGRSVFVGNAGIAGHFTLNHDFLLQHYPLARRFEWVVLLVGTNDLTALLLRRNYEDRKSFVASTTLTNGPQREHTLYHELTVTRRSLETYRNFMYRPSWKSIGRWIDELQRQRQQALKSNPIADVPREELQHAVAIYRENLHRIITTCQNQKQHLVMMTQPQIYRPDLPEELERMTWSPCDSGAYTSAVLAQMMDAFNQAVIDVCRQRRVDYIDLAALLPKDATVFRDHEHFNPCACERVSDIVSDFFTAKLKAQHH